MQLLNGKHIWIQSDFIWPWLNHKVAVLLTHLTGNEAVGSRVWAKSGEAAESERKQAAAYCKDGEICKIWSGLCLSFMSHKTELVMIVFKSIGLGWETISPCFSASRFNQSADKTIRKLDKALSPDGGTMTSRKDLSWNTPTLSPLKK